MLRTSWPTGWSDLTNIEATTEDKRALVIETRRQAYSRDESLKNVPLSDSFDTAPSTSLFLTVARRAGRGNSEPVGTVRLSFRGLNDDPLSTPCSRAFAPEVSRHFSRAGFVEVSRLAIQLAEPEDAGRLYLAVMQNGIRFAEQHGCDFILAPTGVEHTRIYRGMGFEQVGDARDYYGKQTCRLMALSFPAHRAALRGHRRFCRLFADWDRHELAA